MPRVDYIHTNFSSGEISELLTGRIDTEIYNSGVLRAENFYCKPHGPAVRRGGSRYIAKAKLDDTFNVRLKSFVLASKDAFILEFGDNYIRFFTERGQLVGDGVGFPLDQPYEIASPFSHTDLFELSFAQTETFLVIAHNQYPTQVLTRNDTYDWAIDALTFTSPPSEWVAGNYPGAVGFHQQRLYLAGTTDQPQTFWASKTADFINFTIGTNDDDAFKFTIETESDSKIFWFSSSSELYCGTRTAEFKIGSNDFKSAVTPTNIRAIRQTDHGSVRVEPVRLGSRLLFVQSGRRKIRSIRYDIQEDSSVADDITFYCEHITSPGIVDSAFQNNPDTIGWYVRRDGQLVGIGFEPTINVNGAFRYKTDGQYTSVAVAPGFKDEAYDEVWVAVDRIRSGQPAKLIEIIEPDIKRGEDITASFYVDSGLSIPENQLPATTITGLDHLEGRVVDVLVDGWVHPQRTVFLGSILLEQEATQSCHVGLGFNSSLVLLPPEGGNPIGTSQGKIKKTSKAQIRLFRTVGLEIGADGEFERHHFGPPVMNEAVKEFSGDIEVDVDVDYNRLALLEIRQTQPLPMTIVCVMPEIRTEPGG